VTALSRLTAAVLLLAMAGLLVSAKSTRGKKSAKPKPAATQKAAPATPKVEEPWPSKIPLRPNLRFTVRPTLLGLVPPGNEAGFGELFVRILSSPSQGLSDVMSGKNTTLEGGVYPVSFHYEIKEQHVRMEGSRKKEYTTIRRGEANTFHTTPQLTPPMLWGDGFNGSTAGIFWLRPQDFAALKAKGVCDLDVQLYPQEWDPPLQHAMAQLVARRRAAFGLPARWDAVGPTDTHLVVQDWQTSYPAYVNGRRADLPAIRCTDSIRLAMYWILDDADNPLLLKMTYIAPSLAETEPPVVPAKVEGGVRRSDEEKVQPVVEVVQDPAEALVNAGGGFAVVNLDF
jgi:hypothetical protein